MDNDLQINNGTQITLNELITGAETELYYDNPFVRFHEGIAKYPEFHDDIDDLRFTEYSDWERLKNFKPEEGTTVGITNLVPLEDNDQKLYFYDS